MADTELSAWDLRIAYMWENGRDTVDIAAELLIRECDAQREVNRVKALRAAGRPARERLLGWPVAVQVHHDGWLAMRNMVR